MLWLQFDARGNKRGVTTTFDPPLPSLAFAPALAGECTFCERLADPLPDVVAALRSARSVSKLLQCLPDFQGRSLTESALQPSRTGDA